DDLDRDDALELVARAKQRLHALEACLAVHVGERAEVGGAVVRRPGDCPPHVADDPRLVVARLHARSELDRGERIGHARAVVGARRLVVQHPRGVHLAEMQVGIDERLGGEAAARVELERRRAVHPLADRGDASVANREVVERVAPAAQPRTADEEIEARGHSPRSTIAMTGPPPCGPWCMASTETNTAGSPIAVAATAPTAALAWRW